MKIDGVVGYRSFVYGLYSEQDSVHISAPGGDIYRFHSMLVFYCYIYSNMLLMTRGRYKRKPGMASPKINLAIKPEIRWNGQNKTRHS